MAAEYLVPPNVTVSLLIPESDRPEFKVDDLKTALKAYQPAEKQAAVAAKAPEVVTSTLSNGIRVVLEPDHSNSVVSFRISSLGGKRFENPDDLGIMNFISRMIDKGTDKHTEVDISQRIEDMGGRIRGFAGFDSFGLQGHCFSRNLTAGLELLSDIYAHPSFPQDKIERERTLVINQIRTEPDRPVEFALQVFGANLFPHHPYGYDKYGTIETVSGFTRDDLLDCYKRYSVPANTVISLVGDFDPKAVMPQIQDLFGKIPATPLVPPNVPKEHPIEKAIQKTVEIQRAKAHLVIGFRGITIKDNERYALEVLSNILTGQGGRLFLQLRDKESLAYTVAALVRPGIDPGFFAIYMACDLPKVEKAETGLKKEIERIRSEAVSEAELVRGVTNLVGNYQISLQSSSARAENKGLNTLYGLGADYDREYVKRVKAVSAKEVLEAARKFFDPAKSVSIKIMPAKE